MLDLCEELNIRGPTPETPPILVDGEPARLQTIGQLKLGPWVLVSPIREDRASRRRGEPNPYPGAGANLSTATLRSAPRGGSSDVRDPRRADVLAYRNGTRALPATFGTCRFPLILSHISTCAG